jgi:DNA polymerase I-like protein with 3'-5' exonuclease and polymerase domains
LDDTVKLMREFNALIPSVILWQNTVKQKVLNGEDLVTPYGRKRSFWLITDKNKAGVLNEALSFLPQSIASDICLDALVHMQPMFDGLAKVRLTIHDAIVVEAHKDDVGTATDIMRRTMLASARRYTDYVPFTLDFSTGTRWGGL